MGLIRTKQQAREFPTSCVWSPIGGIMGEHFSRYLEPGKIKEWDCKKALWDDILQFLKDQDNGDILGTCDAFLALRFIEKLAVNDDPYFRLASFTINGPLLEDFLEFDGLHNCVEHFFLKRYGISPGIVDLSEGRIFVKFPGFIHRLATGYPSRFKVQVDFFNLVKGLWSLKFYCVRDASGLLFQVVLPEPEEGYQ